MQANDEGKRDMIRTEVFKTEKPLFYMVTGNGKATHLTVGNDETLCGREGRYSEYHGDFCTPCFKAADRMEAEFKATELARTAEADDNEGDDMPKKGAKLPFTVAFEWESGVKGKKAYGTMDEAQYAVDELSDRARVKDRGITVTITNRETGEVFTADSDESATMSDGNGGNANMNITSAKTNGKVHGPAADRGLAANFPLCTGVTSVSADGKWTTTNKPVDCKACVKRLADQEKEEIMPPKKKAAEAPPAEEVAAPAKDVDELISDVHATVDRMKVVVTEDAPDSAEKVDALAAEAEEIIRKLPTNKRTALRAEVTAAKEKPAPSAELVNPDDYRTIPGVVELVTMGAEKVREGVQYGLKLSDAGAAVASITLDMRTRIPDPKTGLPDLHGDTRGAKDAAEAVYSDALKGVDEDDVTTRAAHASLRKATENKRSDVLVDWLRAFDTTEGTEALRELFPVAAERVENARDAKARGEDVDDAWTSPTEAIYALYEEKGVALPRKGRTELERERRAAKSLVAARKELEAAKERAEEGDKEAEAEAEKLAARVTELTEKLPAEKVKELEAGTPQKTPSQRLKEKVTKTRDLLTTVTDAKTFKKLEADEREAAIAQLEALSGYLSTQLAALKSVTD